MSGSLAESTGAEDAVELPRLPWDLVSIQISEATETGWSMSRFEVPRGILEREGAQSFFAAHMRFASAGGAPDAPIDLGRMDAAVKRPLQQYLKTGYLGLTEDTLAALQFAADVFLMQRLKIQLQRRRNAFEFCARFQCLNCRAYVPEEARGDTCRFKPFRRILAGRPTCSRCDLSGMDCSCLISFSRHVFDNEPPPELGGRPL